MIAYTNSMYKYSYIVHVNQIYILQLVIIHRLSVIICQPSKHFIAMRI